MAKKARAGKYNPNFTCQVFKFHQFFTTFSMDVGRCHFLFHAARLLKPCSTTMGIRPWCQSKGFRSIGVEKYWRSPRRNEVVLFFLNGRIVFLFLRKWSNGPYFFATFSWKCWGKDNRKQRNHSNPEYFMVNLLQVADSNGTTLLHVAARAGSFQVVKASSSGVVVHGTETGKTFWSETNMLAIFSATKLLG